MIFKDKFDHVCFKDLEELIKRGEIMQSLTLEDIAELKNLIAKDETFLVWKSELTPPSGNYLWVKDGVIKVVTSNGFVTTVTDLYQKHLDKIQDLESDVTKNKETILLNVSNIELSKQDITTLTENLSNEKKDREADSKEIRTIIGLNRENITFNTESISEIEKTIETQTSKINNISTTIDNLKPVEDTYEEILHLKEAGGLTPGVVYTITDFVTIHVLSTGKIIGIDDDFTTFPVYHLHLTAIANDKFDHRVTCDELPGYELHYSIDLTEYTADQAPEGRVLDKGKITYMKDPNGNSAHYDFLNWRWVYNNKAWGTFRPSKEYSGNTIGADCECVIFKENAHNNTIDSNCHDIVFESLANNNKIGTNCYALTFNNKATNNIIYSSSAEAKFVLLEGLSGHIQDHNINVPISFDAMINPTVGGQIDSPIISYIDCQDKTLKFIDL